MKNKYLKICLLLVIFMISCLFLSNVEAEITGNVAGKETTVTDDSDVSKVANGVVSVISYIGEMAASGVFSVITALINVLTVAMFLILEVVFVGVTQDITQIPLPDTIVFNKSAFFDPNFINPASGSLTGGMQTVLSNLFASLHTIAIAIFVISAMIAGLKMAVSSIAAKKAQYKEAALKWISGFLMLICLKWILAGIFYANEYLVSTLYGTTIDAADLKIPIYVSDAIPIFGQLLSDLIQALEDLTGWTLTFKISGYLGILLANLAKSIGGNIIASIVGFILMGQTLTIVGSYLKRVFMCILLGMISPLIIAVDTFKSSTGQQSTIFKNWLQNFSLTVFMQSFHAVYMVMTLTILAGLYKNGQFNGGLTETQTSIVTIVLTTGLVKLEKLIKGMFGIGDSMAGDLKDGGKSMLKAMGAIKGATAAIGAIKDNAPKMKDAAAKKKAYTGRFNAMKAEDSYNLAKQARKDGNLDDAKKHWQDYKKYNEEAKKNGAEFNPASRPTNNNNSTENKSGGKSGKSNDDFLSTVYQNSMKRDSTSRAEQYKMLEEGIASETANFKSASLAYFMGPANLAAGIGIGLGTGEDISESLMHGGLVTAALDKGAEAVGRRAADKDRKTFYEHEQEEGKKLGYTASEKIIREKTTVEKFVNDKVTPRGADGKVDMKQSVVINPIAVGREIGKQLSGSMDVFTNQMKKELKHIDRNLDDSQ